MHQEFSRNISNYYIPLSGSLLTSELGADKYRDGCATAYLSQHAVHILKESFASSNVGSVGFTMYVRWQYMCG